MTADPANLPRAIQRLSPWQVWAKYYLQQIVQRSPADDTQRREQLHARLAGAALTGAYDSELLTELYDCSTPYLSVVRDVLQPHSDQLATSLWDTLHDTRQLADRRFRAGLALATYATESEHWSAEDYALLAGQLVKENPIHQPALWQGLRPLAPKLLLDLERLFANQELSESQQIGAANALAVFARDDGPRLARLLASATSAQYEILYGLVSSQRDGTATAVLGDILREQPADTLSEKERVALGQRCAGAAISLLRLGEVEKIQGVFQVQDDPESLTQFVHRCRDRSVTAQELVQSLHSATDVRSRFALLLTLGDYPLADVDITQRDGLIQELTAAYRSDPSSAIHGATAWLLRKWGFEQNVTEVDRTPIPYDVTGAREWYVLELSPQPRDVSASQSEALPDVPNVDPKIYFTFIVFPPGEYLMGSPEGEADHAPDERLHRVRLTRPVAFSMDEVTWAQYDPVDDGQTHRAREQHYGRSLVPNDPACGVNWFEAVAYCRWLTRQLGWPESEQCYDDPQSLPKDAEGNPRHSVFYPDRHGVRLPTEAEWQYARRAGMRTAYSFGSDRKLPTHYAWFYGNSENWTHAVGQLRPNLRGLFDVHGNVYEWCHDWYASDLDDGAEDPTGAAAGSYRLAPGGGRDYSASLCRSANRSRYLPDDHSSFLGFRVTIVPSSK